jgi:hypothetical protein
MRGIPRYAQRIQHQSDFGTMCNEMHPEGKLCKQKKIFLNNFYLRNIISLGRNINERKDESTIKTLTEVCSFSLVWGEKLFWQHRKLITSLFACWSFKR